LSALTGNRGYSADLYVSERKSLGANGKFSGTADDVIGEAFGEVSGNTFHLVYDLSAPVNGSKTVLHVDDWLYLVTDSVIMNHSELTKFGLHAADVFLTIQKKG